MPAKKAGWSVDDIVAAIGEIAHDTDSKDRLRALGMLAKLRGEEASIPPPLTDAEKVERLVRLLCACGKEVSLNAFSKAFPGAKPARTFCKTADHPEIEERVAAVSSIKALFRLAPELKSGGGGLAGYPAAADMETRAIWCRNKAREILLERKRREIAEERIACRLPTPAERDAEAPAIGADATEENLPADQAEDPPPQNVPVLRPDGEAAAGEPLL